jgi:hypothetical protein
MTHWLDQPTWDMSLVEMLDTVRTIGRVDRIHITGGEPLEHPQFYELALWMRGYVTGLLTIETAKYSKALMRFDEVYFSFYGDNASDRDQLALIHPRVHVGNVRHIPNIPGNGEPCARGSSGTVSVYNGRLYSCCVSPGIPGASVPLTADWRSKVDAVPMPCGNCRFSGGN